MFVSARDLCGVRDRSDRRARSDRSDSGGSSGDLCGKEGRSALSGDRVDRLSTLPGPDPRDLSDARVRSRYPLLLNGPYRREVGVPQGPLPLPGVLAPGGGRSRGHPPSFTPTPEDAPLPMDVPPLTPQVSLLPTERSRYHSKCKSL